MTSMDAERYIGRAEEEFKSNRIEEALKLANMAKHLNPDCDSIDNIVAVYAVHAAASKKTINGEVDWYAVLGIADRVRVDTEEIKKSYRRLALMVHPDKNSSAAAESAFKLVGEARSVLSQASTREPYDLRTRTRSSSSSTPQAQTSSAMPCDGGFGVYYPGIPIIPSVMFYGPCIVTHNLAHPMFYDPCIFTHNHVSDVFYGPAYSPVYTTQAHAYSPIYTTL